MLHYNESEIKLNKEINDKYRDYLAKQLDSLSIKLAQLKKENEKRSYDGLEEIYRIIKSALALENEAKEPLNLNMLENPWIYCKSYFHKHNRIDEQSLPYRKEDKQNCLHAQLTKMLEEAMLETFDDIPQAYALNAKRRKLNENIETFLEEYEVFMFYLTSQFLQNHLNILLDQLKDKLEGNIDAIKNIEEWRVLINPLYLQSKQDCLVYIGKIQKIAAKLEKELPQNHENEVPKSFSSIGTLVTISRKYANIHVPYAKKLGTSEKREQFISNVFLGLGVSASVASVIFAILGLVFPPLWTMNALIISLLVFSSFSSVPALMIIGRVVKNYVQHGCLPTWGEIRDIAEELIITPVSYLGGNVFKAFSHIPKMLKHGLLFKQLASWFNNIMSPMFDFVDIPDVVKIPFKLAKKSFFASSKVEQIAVNLNTAKEILVENNFEVSQETLLPKVENGQYHHQYYYVFYQNKRDECQNPNKVEINTTNISPVMKASNLDTIFMYQQRFKVLAKSYEIFKVLFDNLNQYKNILRKPTCSLKERRQFLERLQQICDFYVKTGLSEEAGEVFDAFVKLVDNEAKILKNETNGREALLVRAR